MAVFMELGYMSRKCRIHSGTAFASRLAKLSLFPFGAEIR